MIGRISLLLIGGLGIGVAAATAWGALDQTTPKEGTFYKTVSDIAAAARRTLQPDAKSKVRYVYQTAEITRGPILRLVRTTGTVKPVRTIQIGSQLSGRVKSVDADFNDQVKAGDVLAIIEPETFEARTRQASADLRAAEASLLNEMATLTKAEAVLRISKRIHERQQSLGERKLSPTTTVDSAQRDFEVAKAEIEVALANVKIAEARVAQKQAELAQAEIDLNRTRIIAPADGIVLARLVDVGQTVAASFKAPELFTIAVNLDRMNIEAQVNEADIGIVREGNPVIFDVEAYPDHPFKGRVAQVRLTPDIDKDVVTYTVVIEAENADRRLFPGMTANVSIETARRDDALRLPSDAISFKPPKGVSVKQARKSAGRELDLANAIAQRIQHAKHDLSLTDDQIETLANRIAISGPSQFEVALDKVLTPEQRRVAIRLRTERSGARNADVWLLGTKDKLVQRTIRIGLFDMEFSEIIDGPLDVGDKVVVRRKRVKAK